MASNIQTEVGLRITKTVNGIAVDCSSARILQIGDQIEIYRCVLSKYRLRQFGHPLD
jgi:hypothetical protein